MPMQEEENALVKEETMPVHHIGFLDFPLFPEKEWLEFYSTYMMLNIKNHGIYSDKFKLSVIDLSHIELAAEEDKTNGIDYWASLFKAKTWEKIKMLAENNEYLQEAAKCLYVANEEEIVKQKCRAREEAERHERTVKRDMRILREELEKSKANEEKLQAENEERRVNEEKLQTEVADYQRKQNVLETENLVLKSNVSHMDERLKQLECMIKELQKRDAFVKEIF